MGTTSEPGLHDTEHQVQTVPSWHEQQLSRTVSWPRI